MKRSAILTKEQEETFTKIAVEKLKELMRLPQIKTLVKEIELGKTYKEEWGLMEIDERLLLIRDGLVERRRVEDTSKSWINRFLSSPTINRDEPVSEVFFRSIIEKYKLEVTDLQNLINRLQVVPSVRS